MVTETAIKGTPEGRKGVWLIDLETALGLIPDREHIHCFLGNIGCDWERQRLVDFLSQEDVRIGLLFPPQFVMSHQLVALDSEHRRSFDIGEIDESRMEAK